MKTENIGMCAILSYFGMLGPIGFLLLLVIFYAMSIENLALGLSAAFLLALPVVFLGIWFAAKWIEILKECECKKSYFINIDPAKLGEKK